jgi:hypothetical protein
MNSNFRFASLSLAIVMVIFAMFTFPVQAQERIIASSGSIPLSGSYYDSITEENVLLTGTLQLDTFVTGSPTVTNYLIYSSLSDNITAIGQTSGVHYVVSGMNALQFTSPASSLDTPVIRRIVLSSVIYPTVSIGTGVNTLVDNIYTGVTVVVAGNGTLQLSSSNAILFPFDTVTPCIGD